MAPQRLPSIPTQDQSYGYRLDPKSQKLVYNDNPKIIFAQKSSTTATPKDDYFQRTQSQLGKGPKCSMASNGQRSSCEIKHQVEVPNATYYRWEQVGSIEQGMRKSGNKTLTSFKERGVVVGREELVLSKLKRKFGDYVG